jgi:hypothetical protein
MAPESHNGGVSVARRRRSTGSCGNEHANNSRGTVGSGVFCVVPPEVIQEGPTGPSPSVGVESEGSQSRQTVKYGHEIMSLAGCGTVEDRRR